MSARLKRYAGENRGHNSIPAPGDVRIKEPCIEAELLLYLEGLYPNRLPARGTDLRTLDHLTGIREVIDHLRDLHNRQKDEPL